MRTAFRSDDSDIQTLLQSVYLDGEVSVAEFRDLRDKADKFLEEKFVQAPAVDMPQQVVQEMDDRGRHFTEAFIDILKKDVERPAVAKVGEETLQGLLGVQKASDKLVEGLQKISIEVRRKKLDAQGRALLKRSLDSRMAALLVPVPDPSASTALVMSSSRCSTPPRATCAKPSTRRGSAWLLPGKRLSRRVRGRSSRTRSSISAPMSLSATDRRSTDFEALTAHATIHACTPAPNRLKPPNSPPMTHV